MIKLASTRMYPVTHSLQVLSYPGICQIKLGWTTPRISSQIGGEKTPFRQLRLSVRPDVVPGDLQYIMLWKSSPFFWPAS